MFGATLLASTLACSASADRQVEPPALADRIFDASSDTVSAFAYITSEKRLRPGPTRTSRRFDRYTLYVRRLPDGAVVRELPLGDIMNAMEDSTPRILGVLDHVIWIQRDTVEGYRVPYLEPVPFASSATNDDSITASLRLSLAEITDLPFWERPGTARLFTQVRSGLEPFASLSSLASLSPEAGVLMRADRSAWRVASPASVLVMSVAADSTWSLSRVTEEPLIVWTTPLTLRFTGAFVLLDTEQHVIFTDSESSSERSGIRDRIVWVNAVSGDAWALEVSDGSITAITRH